MMYHQSCLIKEKRLFFMKEKNQGQKTFFLWKKIKNYENRFFATEFSLTIASYQFFKNDCISINQGSISKKSQKIFYLKNMFLLEKFFRRFYPLETTFKTGSSRTVENIFPEKISDDLSKSIYFWKIGKRQ